MWMWKWAKEALLKQARTRPAMMMAATYLK